VQKTYPIVSVSDKYNRKRCPTRKPIKTDAMNATFPGHLVPSDHPILDDFFKPRASPYTPVALRSFTKEVSTTIAPSNSDITPADTSNDRTEKRRSKRINQPAGRYRTTPVTLEEIREIDEEIYAKQQPAKKDEQSEDSTCNGANGKRTSPYTSCSASFGIHGPKKYFSNGALDFKCTVMTKTKLLPGRALWPAHHSNNHRHRSQESLVHLGLNPLPTIPEEWRQQHQQQKAVAANNNNSETSSNIAGNFASASITVIERRRSEPTVGSPSMNSPISSQAMELASPLGDGIPEDDQPTDSERAINVG